MADEQALAIRQSADRDASFTLVCDQAIFTSIRTPMGEGYRIIASSPGLRPDEKQMITRFSPSHGALCQPGTTPQPSFWTGGASFYALPGGRLCVACSCDAGGEHTGRGGQRVYTHNVIFSPDHFERIRFNPIDVMRAMVRAKLTEPQLAPPQKLSEVELEVIAAPVGESQPSLSHAMPTALRRYALEAALGGRSLILNLETDWLMAVEAFLLGLPGPMRAEVSFSAGLSFSVARSHRLQWLHDDTGNAKKRATGQPIEFLDAHHEFGGDRQPSAWLGFVEGLWASGQMAELARRTSRDFADVDQAARERIGRLYAFMDELPLWDSAKLMRMAGEHVHLNGQGAEREIESELVGHIQTTLAERFRTKPWKETAPLWSALLSMWRMHEAGTAFADPLIDEFLRSASGAVPVETIALALQVARDMPSSLDKDAHTARLDTVLIRVANWSVAATDEQLGPLPRLCEPWRLLRPRCPIIAQLIERCTATTGTDR